MNASRATEPAPAGDERLDSWKEIAAYFRRTEATVRRWEKDGLPVHRHLHSSRARVFAYRSELDAWWRQEPQLVEASGSDASSTPSRFSRSRWYWAIAVSGSLLVVCLVAGILWIVGSRSASVPLNLIPFMTMEGVVSDPAFSPDGNQVAFAWAEPGEARRQIYVKLIGSETPLRLTHSADGEDQSPVWSPDGKQIAFLRGTKSDVEIVTVPALGGPERRLLSLRSDRYYGLDWSPDGKQIAFAQRASSDQPYAVFLLSIDDGQTRQVTFPTTGGGDRRFAFSPDGMTLAFVRYADPQSVEIVPINPQGPRQQPRSVASSKEWIGSLAWANQRTLVISGNRDGVRRLWRLDVESGRDQYIEAAGQDAYSPAVARRGHRLAFIRMFQDSDLWRSELLSPHGPAAAPSRIAFSSRAEGAPRFSPDGKRLAFPSYRSGVAEIWTSDADGRNGVQLTFLKTEAPETPTWSPDGQTIAFGDGVDHVISVADGKRRKLSPNLKTFGGPSWSHDGRSVYFWRTDLPGPVQIWKIPSTGGEPVQVTKNGGFSSQESPDGRWLYFTKTVKGIWRMPVQGGEETLVVDDFEPSLPGYWAVSEDGIYYLDNAAKPKPTLAFFEVATRKTKKILEFPGIPDAWFGGLTISPDRHWIIFSQQQYSSFELVLAENFS